MPDAPVSGAPAGWYGKLACLGDFASRRLSRAFVERWDGWLQQVLPASRARLGDGWLEAYLTSPVWRFIEWPEPGGAACDAAGTVNAGVLMPSVDKVGRYFPLCVAAVLPGLVGGADELRALLRWLDRIEALALATLDTRHLVQQFDDALLAEPPPLPRRAATVATLARPLAAQLRGASGGLLRLPPDGALEDVLIDLGCRTLADSARGATLWWAAMHPGGDGPVFACRGLPDEARFTAMLRVDAAPP